MAGLSYRASSSPIHRGVFVARSVLGRMLRPPPEAVAPVAPELQPELTTRQRVEAQTRSGACMTCHGMINPLGFSFEQFDAVGRFRDREKSRPIDASGEYISEDGSSVRFQGVRELADFLAKSDETHEAFVEQLWHHAVKQPIRAWSSDRADRLAKEFATRKFDIRKLLVTIAVEACSDPAKPAVAAGSASKEPRPK
jgi:hypothetical protein